MSEAPPSTLFVHRIPPTVRPIDPHWKCQKSGECCSLPSEVVMTVEERSTLLPKIPLGIKTAWREVEGTNLVALKAQPCPFYVFKECLVYDVRPYNCRRFACMRPDPKSEPFEFDNSPSKLTGCKNADDRFYTSRAARRLLVHIQRRAQIWARKHGWGNA